MRNHRVLVRPTTAVVALALHAAGCSSSAATPAGDDGATSMATGSGGGAPDAAPADAVAMDARSTGSSTDAASDPRGTPAEGGVTDCDLVPSVPVTHGPILHVAVSGNDTSNDGSSGQPFATLSRALENAQSGTRVQLGDGTYALGATPMRLANLNGTAAEPIVVTAEVGAHPVFDGSAVVNVNYDNEPFVSFSASSYVFVDSIEIVGRAYPTDVTSQLDSNGHYTGPRYAGGGIGFLNSSFCTLTRSNIHQIPNEATLEIGADFTIAGNTFYDIVLENTNSQRYFQDSWPSAHIAWYVANGDGSFKDWSYRRHYFQNTLRNSWGEGYNCLFTDTCSVIGNSISQVHGAHIYLDHARNVQILRNLIPDDVEGGGLAFDNENYGGSVPAMSQDNILIANNYIGAMPGIALFRFDGVGSATDTWSNFRMVNNILGGGGYNGESFYVQKVNGVTEPKGGLIANNIFLTTTLGITLQDASAWTVRNNVFAGATPAITTGVIVTDDINATPSFLGPTDGSARAGFTLLNAGALQVPFDPDVAEDALCAPRDGATTAAGIIGP